VTARAAQSAQVLGGSAALDCARFMLRFLALDGFGYEATNLTVW
jgi:hypothetical protein